MLKQPPIQDLLSKLEKAVHFEIRTFSFPETCKSAKLDFTSCCGQTLWSGDKYMLIGFSPSVADGLDPVRYCERCVRAVIRVGGCNNALSRLEWRSPAERKAKATALLEGSNPLHQRRQINKDLVDICSVCADASPAMLRLDIENRFSMLCQGCYDLAFPPTPQPPAEPPDPTTPVFCPPANGPDWAKPPPAKPEPFFLLLFATNSNVRKAGATVIGPYGDREKALAAIDQIMLEDARQTLASSRSKLPAEPKLWGIVQGVEFRKYGVEMNLSVAQRNPPKPQDIGLPPDPLEEDDLEEDDPEDEDWLGGDQ